jgi:hypothetical protein
MIEIVMAENVMLLATPYVELHLNRRHPLEGVHDLNAVRHEPLYVRALAICEKALGREHPNVVTCLQNYALLLIEIDSFHRLLW